MSQYTPHLRPTPLPVTQADLLASKTMKDGRNLNDEVDEAHVACWLEDSYRDLHDAVYDEEAINGSMQFDNFAAALVIKEWAMEDSRSARYPRLCKAKPATIAKALGVVTRRYNQSRNVRRRTVHGEIVGGNGDNE